MAAGSQTGIHLKKIDESVTSEDSRDGEIKSACKEFAAYEVPKKMVLLPEAFTPENGILTPTLKLKRRKVHDHFGDMIEALYE